LGEFLLIDTLIEMLTLHVDLDTWEVLQGKFLVLLLVDHLLPMMIIAMADTWNDPQTIVTVISVITVLVPAQSVPILRLRKFTLVMLKLQSGNHEIIMIMEEAVLTCLTVISLMEVTLQGWDVGLVLYTMKVVGDLQGILVDCTTRKHQLLGIEEIQFQQTRLAEEMQKGCIPDMEGTICLGIMRLLNQI